MYKETNLVHYPCDPAYFFDRLSIQEVKLEKAEKSKKPNLAAQLQFLINNLSEQIGDLKYETVKKSIEYSKLKSINKDFFELVDYCKNYSVEFKFADALNHKRWELKNEIQKKYFGRGTSEVKLNYNDKNSGPVNPD